MDNHVVFTGDLIHDAPGLGLSLRKYLEINELRHITEAYRWAVHKGGLNEFPVNRKPGMNFNPKPARYCQILISSLNERNVSQLVAAMLTCVDALALEGVNDFEREAQLAREAHKVCTDGTLGCTQEIEDLVTTKLLDDVRHLHMTSLSPEQVMSKISFIDQKIIPFVQRAHMKVLLKAAMQKAQVNLINRTE